ncbi:NAD(P)/FAD-dependent oxidoreductase [Roseivirga sp.]|uniref:NAD(P)/FAD-dependent oxidoreductase n=1 Tax=Roseivirga sp. TaxID=1964215 RepID=UPI003B8CD17D
MSKQEIIVIIGAGPAGLTAAYELATKSDKHIVVLEADDQVGGISKTVDYKGNKIDIGGHRFFSKSEWVLNWWQKFLPVLNDGKEIHTTYQNSQKAFSAKPFNNSSEPHMLIRPRKSRIFYNKQLLDYPIKLNLNTLFRIGFWKSFSIFISLLISRFRPIKEEKNLEDFFINRFGKKLYETFFKEYTEKVWGKACTEISPEWGRQRIKGLSFKKILKHYFTTLFYPMRQTFGNKEVEQTLTEYFLYPQKGPGQLWETVEATCRTKGVDIRMQQRVTKVKTNGNRINAVEVWDKLTQTTYTLPCDQLISTMPVRHLIAGLDMVVPEKVKSVASSLEYRDFMIVGILLDELKLKNGNGESIDDNWLYIQDQGMQVGRVQLFHNWSPEMTADPDKSWIGAEYFCQEGDDLWQCDDDALISLAAEELHRIGLLDSSKVLDGTVVRMPKAYPSYVGSYRDFESVKSFFNTIDNVYLIGRNGTHKYNNQDHSMLTALEAVNSLMDNGKNKQSIWHVNTESAYHEAS